MLSGLRVQAEYRRTDGLKEQITAIKQRSRVHIRSGQIKDSRREAQNQKPEPETKRTKHIRQQGSKIKLGVCDERRVCGWAESWY